MAPKFVAPQNSHPRPSLCAGSGPDRLRRLTREISTLSGTLPVEWESSVLVAVDEERLDVLRAVIFPPSGTPYSGGTFAFDILLPQDYPQRPPKVQFLTTGGGRVRFNPNLYDDGKVRLGFRVMGWGLGAIERSRDREIEKESVAGGAGRASLRHRRGAPSAGLCRSRMI